jgi:transcription elongation factor SPT4
MTDRPRNLRACLLCSIVRPYSDFLSHGCPNCEEQLQMKGQPEAIGDMTSQVFEGLISLHDPANSWVAKWQRLSQYEPGTYATKVVGRLPDDVVADLLENHGMRYLPRDGSSQDEELGS